MFNAGTVPSQGGLTKLPPARKAFLAKELVLQESNTRIVNDDDDGSITSSQLTASDEVSVESCSSRNIRDQHQSVDDERIPDYKFGDHAEYMHIRQTSEGNEFCDMSHFFLESRFLNLVTDFCSPMSYQQLMRLFVGVEDVTHVDAKVERLPVRTMTIRVRTDVECSDIIAAIQDGCEGYQDATIRIKKKERVHFQCVVTPLEGDMTIRPSYTIDCQIGTERTGSFERRVILRVFASSPWEDFCSPEKKSDEIYHAANLYADNDLKIPCNMHLKDACIFVQHLRRERMHTTMSFNSIMDRGCPADSPLATTACLKEQYENDEMKATTRTVSPKRSHTLVEGLGEFPALRLPDWMLLQSSWPYILRIWKGLSSHLCSFNTIDQMPIMDPSVVDIAPVFDPQYCTQLRLVSHDNLYREVKDTLDELRLNFTEGEECGRIFLRFVQLAYGRYGMKFPDFESNTRAHFEVPPLMLPERYTFLAIKALQTATNDSDDPAVLADDGAHKMYDAFFREDEKMVKAYLKLANSSVMERLVDRQTFQMTLVAEIENDSTTSAAAKKFGGIARKALNHKGRVDRRLIGRVPLLDFCYKKGSCTITLTAMLCISKRTFQDKIDLFDLKAVYFEKLSSNSLAVVCARDSEVLYKMNYITGIHMEELIFFLRALQGLQSFVIAPIIICNKNGEKDHALAARSKRSWFKPL